MSKFANSATRNTSTKPTKPLLLAELQFPEKLHEALTAADVAVSDARYAIRQLQDWIDEIDEDLNNLREDIPSLEGIRRCLFQDAQ
jgi:hypothetical protein